MKPTYRYSDHLPLAAESGYARTILVESCKMDEDHYQIRGELTDNRGDFEDLTHEIPVHGMVVRLTLRFDSNVITNAEFATPRLAFPGLCDQLPVGPEKLIGLRAAKGFTEELRRLYGGTKSCWHLFALLQAIVPALMQCAVWNGAFRKMDEIMPVEAIGMGMQVMTAQARNSCHAWEDEKGFIQQDFAQEDYSRMLNRMAPRLKKRWEESKKGGEDV